MPGIYEKTVGEPYPGPELDDAMPFGTDELRLLREASGLATDQPGDRQDAPRLRYEMLRRLLALEHRYRTMGRRAGLWEEMDKIIDANFFQDENDALQWAIQQRLIKDAAQTAVDEISANVDLIVTDEPVLPGQNTNQNCSPVVLS